jgi:hypothetical protein
MTKLENVDRAGLTLNLNLANANIWKVSSRYSRHHETSNAIEIATNEKTEIEDGRICV